MPSRLLRRSGVAIVNVAEILEWVPDVVVQVGVGQYYEEVAVMKECWPELVVHGIEAHPGIVQQLAGNYPGIVTSCAIGEEKGKATLYAKKRHKDGSSMFPHSGQLDREVYQEVEVDVETLDDVTKNLCKHYGASFANKQIMLWLDCEGSELAALKGGTEFLEKVNVINIETTANPPGEGWCNPVEVHDWLMEYGFLRQTNHTYRDSVGQCDCIYVRRHLFHPPTCACPCQVVASQRGLGPGDIVYEIRDVLAGEGSVGFELDAMGLVLFYWITVVDGGFFKATKRFDLMDDYLVGAKALGRLIAEGFLDDLQEAKERRRDA